MSRPDAALALPSEWESVPRGDNRDSGDHLEIAQRFSFLWNVPYYRLYAVDGEQRQFLMERMKPEDIQARSAYIAAATGWRAPTSITTRLL